MCVQWSTGLGKQQINIPTPLIVVLRERFRFVFLGYACHVDNDHSWISFVDNDQPMCDNQSNQSINLPASTVHESRIARDSVDRVEPHRPPPLLREREEAQTLPCQTPPPALTLMHLHVSTYPDETSRTFFLCETSDSLLSFLVS